MKVIQKTVQVVKDGDDDWIRFSPCIWMKWPKNLEDTRLMVADQCISMENRFKALSDPSSDVCCPFCETGTFDLVGLKKHLHKCEKYLEVFAL